MSVIGPYSSGWKTSTEAIQSGGARPTAGKEII